MLCPRDGHELPLALRMIDADRVIAQLEDAVGGPEKDRSAEQLDIPDICKSAAVRRQEIDQRCIPEKAFAIGRKIAHLSLSAGIDALIVNRQGSHDGTIWERIGFPVCPVEGEESLVIGKVQVAVPILTDIPGLGAAVEVGLTIVDDQGQTDGILTMKYP